MEEITLTTQDDVRLYADYYKSSTLNAPAVLLLHMMPETKESWREFAKKLREVGFQVLAIDFRGHGKSVFKNNHLMNYKNFTDTQHQQKIHDIEIAVKFLIDEKGPSSIFLVGASIGANLAIQYMANHTRIIAGAILSPGLDYRGVKPELFIKNLDEDQAIYLAASEDDKYSADSAKELYNLAKTAKKLKLLRNAGHGTDMFNANPDLMDEIIDWLRNIHKHNK
ncbi:MAG: hypothetical protein US71_C0016G0003 [Parcubacteria group bacterium GW2011_GWD2_38_12]|nr:MAG: hypothetical protein US56_C0009G0002 [Candidatus Moranbacteria bacterium GW2011_GWF2_37_7]KKQ42167.1 MAG: hypothetical protein US61_C0031G0003 [Parcubacteria group bacterium GW2011_GWE2_37_8]KKQ51189.1 MAG: hypothetical protein US71_C0016G0003 [Parcubacteria group bacterium GW2011_GWD2_38_12]KKQ58504.1 MAG: hypothetical protein US79_C0006G0011 [Parcubacteria group bacterium GW2011_GWC1_38_17]KKQ59407.1 MAG: hypothetical protein US78_C0004G0003 [Parcubacteria group bacterium GW2011_GWD1_